MTTARVRSSDSQTILKVVSYSRNRLHSLLFGQRQTGLDLPRTRYRVGWLSEYLTPPSSYWVFDCTAAVRISRTASGTCQMSLYLFKTWSNTRLYLLNEKFRVGSSTLAARARLLKGKTLVFSVRSMISTPIPGSCGINMTPSSYIEPEMKLQSNPLNDSTHRSRKQDVCLVNGPKGFNVIFWWYQAWAL